MGMLSTQSVASINHCNTPAECDLTPSQAEMTHFGSRALKHLIAMNNGAMIDRFEDPDENVKAEKCKPSGILSFFCVLFWGFFCYVSKLGANGCKNCQKNLLLYPFLRRIKECNNH